MPSAFHGRQQFAHYKLVFGFGLVKLKMLTYCPHDELIADMVVFGEIQIPFIDFCGDRPKTIDANRIPSFCSIRSVFEGRADIDHRGLLLSRKPEGLMTKWQRVCRFRTFHLPLRSACSTCSSYKRYRDRSQYRLRNRCPLKSS